MIGIVIAGHQDLAPALRRAAEGIVGPMESVEAVSLSYDEAPAAAQKKLEEAVSRAEGGDGVLIFTDMFGGTPTNLSLPLLAESRVEVLTGVNLPMVLKAHTARQEMDLGRLSTFLREYGSQNIVLASQVWNARPGAAV